VFLFFPATFRVPIKHRELAEDIGESLFVEATFSHFTVTENLVTVQNSFNVVYTVVKGSMGAGATPKFWWRFGYGAMTNRDSSKFWIAIDPFQVLHLN